MRRVTFYDEGNELNGEWADRRVLVTGGTGFLGQCLTRRLVELGAQVTVTLCDSDGPEQIAALPPRVGRLDGDVRHEEQVRRVVEAVAPDTVFHLAAVGVNDFFIAAEVALQVNLHGTLNLLRAVRDAGVRRIVVAGTCYEYGEGGALDPGNVYAASKVAAWAFCRMHYRAFGTPVVVARPFNVYGPGQDERALIPSAMRAALSGQDFPTTPGEQRRDFIYVDDLIEGFLCVALADGVEGQSLDLGSGQATAIREVARRIFDLVGAAERLQVGALPYRPGVVWELVADAARTTRLTGWQAQIGLEQGLRATIEGVKRKGFVMKLSIIICAYNERKTILDAIQQAHAVDLGPGWDKEILVVDNCSTDGTRELLQEVNLPGVRVIYHPQNLGKSGSLKTGIAEVSGDYFVIFDADLEYEASDIPRMVAQIVPGETVAVYGSRTLGGRRIYKYAKNYWGVRFLSAVTNLFYGSRLSDVAVGLKLARTEVVRALDLQGSGIFGLEFEMTFKLLKRGHEIREIATAYHPRTVAEGKKLKAFRTGFHTLWLIVKMRFWD